MRLWCAFLVPLCDELAAGRLTAGFRRGGVTRGERLDVAGTFLSGERVLPNVSWRVSHWRWVVAARVAVVGGSDDHAL